LLAANSSIEAQFDSLLQYSLANTTASDYGSYYLSNTTFDVNNDGSRQWTWQVCSELGWFNTAPQENSMRSTRLNMAFYEQWCRDNFGQDVFAANWTQNLSAKANLDMGGRGIQATNLIMTNGCEDPWQWASINTSQNGIKAYYIECEDCAHCVELYTPSENDSWSLWWTRLKIKRNFAKWLGVSW